MRLTLRTLLAYLDGNLEPEDAEDIGKKIEESEFASKLVHAIRECVQRPRLGSPQLVGRGLGADPNTVAEYLEYRLADERVPEFERVCLESEVHLAEVASCHQILTLVLGEPAEIEPSARERMYALAAQADAPPPQLDSIRQAVSAPVASAPPAAPPQVPPVVRRTKPEVPEYLRESRVRIWPIVAMVLVAATLTFAGLLFFGPAPFREQMTALVSDRGTPTAEADPKATDDSAAGADTSGAGDSSGGPTGADSSGTDSSGTDSSDANTPNAISEEPSPAPADEPRQATGDPPAMDDAPAALRDGPDDAPPTDPYADEPAPPAEEPAAAEPPTAEPDPTLTRPTTEMPAPTDSATAPLPPEPMPLGGARVTPLTPGAAATPLPTAPAPGELPTEDRPDDPLSTPVEADGSLPAAADAPRAAPAEGFGRFTAKQELLLRYDEASGEWMRVPAGALLEKGDRLISLPKFQPTVTLSSNFQIQADGPASIQLVGWDEAGLPILEIEYGRLLIDTIGRADNSLRLRIDGHEPMLTFVDPQSTLAIEVFRELAPGKDPQAGSEPLVADVYATSGIVRVSSQDAAPVELQAPAVMPLLAAGSQPVAGEFPGWVTRQVPSRAARRTASDLDAFLTTEMPVGLQLRELSDPQHKLARKGDLRTLAIRGLTYLGSFEPSVAALNDPALRPYWPEIRSELQAALARSPESASRVRAAFVKKRGEADGVALDRMLWGYTVNDMQAGADADLVAALNRSDALDFRVLGIAALEDFTGAHHGYYPDDNDFKRQHSYNRWKNMIGKIKPRAVSTSPTRSAGTK